MKTTHKQTLIRHEPIQERSAKRVEHIMDCGSQLIAEVGYDRATTNDIAKRAQIPIGSFYQYFPNKESLLHALSTRYLIQLKEHFAEYIQKQKPDTTLQEFLTYIIEELVNFRKKHKGFKQMFLSAHLNNELAVTSKIMNDEFISLICNRLSGENINLSEARKLVIAHIILGMIRSLFECLSLMDDVMWQDIKEETIKAISVYTRSVNSTGQTAVRPEKQ